MTYDYDIVIVGAGPAGIFTALQLVANNYEGKILICEKGKAVENRSCPKHKTANFVGYLLIVVVKIFKQN